MDCDPVPEHWLASPVLRRLSGPAQGEVEGARQIGTIMGFPGRVGVVGSLQKPASTAHMRYYTL